MDTIVCENIFVSESETDRSNAFNETWQIVVNLMLNKQN